MISQLFTVWLGQITGAPLSYRNAFESSSCSASLDPMTQTFNLARDCLYPQSSFLISSFEKDQDYKFSKGLPGRRRTARVALISLFRVMACPVHFSSGQLVLYLTPTPTLTPAAEERNPQYLNTYTGQKPWITAESVPSDTTGES